MKFKPLTENPWSLPSQKFEAGETSRASDCRKTAPDKPGIGNSRGRGRAAERVRECLERSNRFLWKRYNST